MADRRESRCVDLSILICIIHTIPEQGKIRMALNISSWDLQTGKEEDCSFLFFLLSDYCTQTHLIMQGNLWGKCLFGRKVKELMKEVSQRTGAVSPLWVADWMFRSDYLYRLRVWCSPPLISTFSVDSSCAQICINICIAHMYYITKKMLGTIAKGYSALRVTAPMATIYCREHAAASTIMRNPFVDKAATSP